MHVLDIIQKSVKKSAEKIGKQYRMNHVMDGLEDAKVFDTEQKGAILQIADTEGFKVIMQYEENIIKKCEEILGMDSLPDNVLRKVQLEYSIAKGKYSFLKNLADPNVR